ncbi:hypothetical protein EIN_046480, partial [Entamoeba invadens IP1]
MKIITLFFVLTISSAVTYDDLKAQLAKGDLEIQELREKVIDVLQKGTPENLPTEERMKCLSGPETSAVKYSKIAAERVESAAITKSKTFFNEGENDYENKVDHFIDSLKYKAYMTTLSLLVEKSKNGPIDEKESMRTVGIVVNRTLNEAKKEDGVDKYIQLEKEQERLVKERLTLLYAREELNDQVMLNKIEALLYSYQLEKKLSELKQEKRSVHSSKKVEDVKKHGKKYIEKVREVEKKEEKIKTIKRSAALSKKEVKKTEKFVEKIEKKLQKIEQMKHIEDKKDAQKDKVLDTIETPKCEKRIISHRMEHFQEQTISLI